MHGPRTGGPASCVAAAPYGGTSATETQIENKPLGEDAFLRTLRTAQELPGATRICCGSDLARPCKSAKAYAILPTGGRPSASRRLLRTVCPDCRRVARSVDCHGSADPDRDEAGMMLFTLARLLVDTASQSIRSALRVEACVCISHQTSTHRACHAKMILRVSRARRCVARRRCCCGVALHPAGFD